MYYTYMIRCSDNSIYTGITVDPKRRLEEHINKTEKCAKYTLRHEALTMEALWQSEGRVQASRLLKKEFPQIRKKLWEKNFGVKVFV